MFLWKKLKVLSPENSSKISIVKLSQKEDTSAMQDFKCLDICWKSYCAKSSKSDNSVMVDNVLSSILHPHKSAFSHKTHPPAPLRPVCLHPGILLSCTQTPHQATVFFVGFHQHWIFPKRVVVLSFFFFQGFYNAGCGGYILAVSKPLQPKAHINRHSALMLTPGFITWVLLSPLSSTHHLSVAYPQDHPPPSL